MVDRWVQAAVSPALLLLLVLGGLSLVQTLGPPRDPGSAAAAAGTSLHSLPAAAPAGRSATFAGSSASVSPVSTIEVGGRPYITALDLANGYLYVSTVLGTNVTVINGTSVVGSVTVGPDPWTPVYDSVNGYVYVPDEGGLSVINGTSVLANVSIADEEVDDLAVDTSNGFVYAVSEVTESSWEIDVINGTTPVGTISGVGCPFSLAYDPADEEVYADSILCLTNSDRLVVVNGTSVVATLSPGEGSVIGYSFDSGNGDLYCSTDGWVWVVSGTTALGNLSVGTDVWFGKPYMENFPTYDPVDGYVYVPNSNSSSVSVIAGTTVVATVNVPAGPNAVVGAGGLVYVADALANNVTVLNGTTGVANLPVGSTPVYETYDPTNGLLYVSNLRSGNISAIQTSLVRTTVPGSGGGSSTPSSVRNGGVYVLLGGAASGAVAALCGTRWGARRRKAPPRRAPA